jgi:hypothetical protein
MRTTVADAAELSVDREDTDLAPLDACDETAASLQLFESADVVPASHAATSPRRSP